MTKIGAYIHAKPDGSPFYVGKGTPTRMRSLTKNRNSWHNHITKKYGLENIQCLFLECSDEKTAFELEKGLIKALKANGYTLCNLTLGGEGPSGYKHDREIVERIREKNTGRQQPPEERAMRSKALTGVKKTKPRTEEHRFKLGISARGKGWYNDGSVSVFCLPEHKPDGFTAGRLMPWMRKQEDKN